MLIARIRSCVFLAGFTASIAVLSVANGQDRGADLRKAGIEPTKPAIEKYLQSLVLTPEQEARIRQLLNDLGGERYQVREKAIQTLLSLPPIPDALLKEAADKNLETRARIAKITASPPYAERNGKLLAVFRFVEAERIKGLAPLILELIPNRNEQSLHYAAVKAFEASVESTDGKALRRTLAESRNEDARVFATGALTNLFGKDAETELETLLADRSHRVRLEAAAGLLNIGNRKSLSVLVECLQADLEDVRHDAAYLLRTATGSEIEYASYDEPKNRAAGVSAWKAWLEKEGSTAKLRVPVPRRPVLLGRILIGIHADKLLREIDFTSEKTIFETGGFNYLWGCHATPDGHRFAVDYENCVVVEYDNASKECWRQKLPGSPSDVQRLANGRTLLPLPESDTIVEIDKSGAIAWKVSVPGRPTSVQRLSNGHTLVNLQGGQKVVEIDAAGTIVWQLQGMRNALTAQGLDNGNVLVADMGLPNAAGGISEYNRAGKVVWSCKEKIDNPAQAQRLPNGHTLISGASGIMEFDADSKLLRQIHVKRSRFFAY